MPYLMKHSPVAAAISLALTSALFTAHAAVIDFANLPASGAVTDLPAEIQALIPATANANFSKNTGDPNYVYQYSPGNIPIYGDGITLEGPGAEAFEHSVTVIQNSTSGSPGVIFGDDLTIRTQSKVAANNGKDVDGIRTHGMNTPANPVFIITGDRTHIYVNGQSGDGINAGYSSFSQGSLGSANIYVGDDLYIETTGSTGRGISAYALNDASKAKNNVIVGDRAHIVTRGTYAEGIRTNQSGSYVRLGDEATIETYGTSAYGLYAGSASKIELGKSATITTDAASASGVYSTGSSTITLDEGATITTNGASAHGVYAYTGAVNLGDNVTIAVNSSEKTSSSAQAPHGMYAWSRGVIALAGGATITTAGQRDSGSYVLNASNGGVIDASAGGKFILNGDILSAGGVAATSALPAQNSTITLTMDDNSLWNGASFIESNAAGTGTIALTMNDAVWNLRDSSTLTSLTLNAGGTINFQHAEDAAWQTLTIKDDFIGNGGKLVFNTVLFDDTSETDKLIVEGNTSGHTGVEVNNIGGAGAQTVEGIEIVSVGGNSEGTFEKASRIVAGGYDYNVVQKGKNWFLTSLVEPVDPVDPPVDPVDPPVDPVIPPQEPVPPAAPPKIEHQYRPEFGSYLANSYAANTLFMTRLHDRLGETQYTDMLTGEQKVTSLWMRNVGGHTRFNDGSGQLKTTANRYVLQLGGDVAQWSTDGLDRWHLGLMAGYGNSQSRSASSLTGYRSRGEVNGYSVGLYGTWYANEADKSGTYVDSWVLYNWFDNKVMGQDQATESYRSSGVTASVEAGYSVKVGESDRNSYWIQPKAQAVWMDVQADDHRERNGTRVKDETQGNLMTRLGVKAYISGHNAIDDGKSRTFQPFIEANWIHNTQTTRIRMDDVSNDMRGSRNIGELKTGVEGQITPQLSVWGNVAQQIGDKGYSDTQGMLGVKYSFK
ncbi:autotransporter outer membrane beta-barrel domain-containing protein [Enterobacter roggenkampii]|uniref:autotransporter outer membrane beta-barrel domain-containing protein n=1 Tax=Enterobacter roggenkampii TaxID=1812935 RepID=UPI00107E769E|nr:autotransporter outer membrane beta-barrel domain-containing protein [Enterobacter roggenkampii]MEB6118246.1 autotransporter outer membrane beta-barrel domain-containing protein [Enterobacter roggenkampii]QBX84776.1 autotransporter outer membrane beta-barrel domain-containing protein [Enterobacter roggenkampii]UWI97042.1 autotransporter outer membrane beta-barrel domain-containing protein [Enterobacter roggenkampii]